LFPGLSELINEFLKNLGSSFFSNKSVETDRIVKEISKYISSKKGFKSQMSKWTMDVFSDVEKVLLVLYEINLLGFRKESVSAFYPTKFEKTNMVVIDPIFYATIFEDGLKIEADDPVKKLETAKNTLIGSISRLTNDIGSSSSRKIDENRSQAQSVVYPQSDILYEIIQLIWSIRQLEKLLIAYGSEFNANLVKDLPNLLAMLKANLEQLSLCFDTDISNLYTLAILANGEGGKFIDNPREFEKEMGVKENASIYESCKMDIWNWIMKLGQEEYVNHSDKLQDVLISLRTAVSDIQLDSNVAPV